MTGKIMTIIKTVNNDEINHLRPEVNRCIKQMPPQIGHDWK